MKNISTNDKRATHILLTLLYQRRINTIVVGHVIQHILIPKLLLNCDTSQMNTAEADSGDCAGTKKVSFVGKWALGRQECL